MKKLLISNTISEAINTYADNIKKLLMISLIIYLPANLIINSIPINYELNDIELTEENLNLVVNILISSSIKSLLSIISSIAIIHLIANKKSTVKESLNVGLSKFLKVLITSIILAISVTLLTLLLIIPGIIYAVYWLFAINAVVLNDKTGINALKHSKKLVKNKWLKVFAYAILIGIITALITAIPSTIHSITPQNIIIDSLLMTVIDLLNTLPLVAITVMYIKLGGLKN